jgi:hypothetical protein
MEGKTMRFLAALAASVCLASCGTVQAPEVSLAETAIFVNAVYEGELDLTTFEGRLIIYEAADVYASFKRGEITRPEAVVRIARIIEASNAENSPDPLPD